MSAPLYLNVQQRQETQADGSLAWGPVYRSPNRPPFLLADPAAAIESLWKRRQGKNRVRIPGGLEFDDTEPCEGGGFRTIRVRVTYETPEGVLFDAKGGAA